MFLGAVAVALVLRLAGRLLLKLRPTASETTWLVEGLRLSSWLVLLTGLAWSVRLANWPAAIEETVVPLLTALAIWLVARAIVRTAIAVIHRQWHRWFPTLPPTTLVQFIVGIAVYTVALLMILHQFGLSITPLLTAIGVSGLAVALGVHDTLSNLFAGISLSLARLIRPGDYVRLENGMEGIVQDIGWRYSTLQTPQQAVIVIPNSRLSQLIVTNFSMPEKRTLVEISLTLPTTDSLERQLAALTDALQMLPTQFPSVLATPPPSFRIVGLTDKGQLQVRIEFWLANPRDRAELTHAVNLRLSQALYPPRSE